jgi:adenine-specific DNA-methyltransferase
MLYHETEKSMSLLNIDQFKNPFEYQMKIANGVETKWTSVDLVETFNYLLGLHVVHIGKREKYVAEFQSSMDTALTASLKVDDHGQFVFKEVEGISNEGDKVLVVWRTMSGDLVKDNAVLDAYFHKKRYNTKDFEFNKIYVNGDNNLQNLRLDNENWKVVLIEEEFKKRMFDTKEF